MLSMIFLRDIKQFLINHDFPKVLKMFGIEYFSEPTAEILQKVHQS